MRKLQTAVLGLAVLASTAGMPHRTERYTIDKSHSSIEFSVRHLGVTNVKGQFNSFEGEILIDEADITKSSARITIDAASIDTNHQRRDADLRGEDFFEVEKYPTITFVSTRVQRNGEQLALVGNLTLRDVTKEVTIPFELAGPLQTANGQKRIGAEGSFKIDRFDYGLKWNRMTEAVAVVGADVKITLNVAAVTARPPQAPPAGM